jgi:hypothetical protein
LLQAALLLVISKQLFHHPQRKADGKDCGADRRDICDERHFFSSQENQVEHNNETTGRIVAQFFLIASVL